LVLDEDYEKAGFFANREKRQSYRLQVILTWDIYW
jgi:hypothetical protein